MGSRPRLARASSAICLRRAAVAACLGLALLLGTAAVPGAGEAAAACRTTSYIPSLGTLNIRNVQTGQTISLRRGNYAGRPTVFVWSNFAFVGQYYVPVNLARGEIAVLLRTEQRYETWLGRVRLVTKVVPFVRACGAWFW